MRLDTRELIRALTPDQRVDKINYNKNTHDFVYTKFPRSIMKAFLSDPKQVYKKHRNPTDPIVQYSFDHLRKFHDAILFGANRANERLPAGYGQEMKKFLDSLKRSKIKAKQDGELVEGDADPINLPLYRLLCEWALTMGDTFMWLFTVLLWNCMARCANIDTLQFANISMGTDSAIITFDSTKMDKSGERTTPKNVYANPYDYRVCFLQLLGVT